MEQTLPKAIQAELDAAAEIEAKLAEEQAARNPNTDPAPNNDAKNPPAEPAPEPQGKAEPTTPAPKSDEETWQRRFEILTGKYNAEVPRLHEQLRDQTKTLEALQQQLEQIKTTPQPAPAPETPLVTSQDEETFGADLIDLQRRVTTEGIAKAVEPLLKRVAELENTIKNMADLPKKVDYVVEQQVQSAEDRYWNAVKTAIPDWDSVDVDPRWIEFLDGKPPFSVKTYRELALEAIQAGLVPPVVELVSAWKEQAGITKASQNQKNAQQELRSQVAPTKSNASATPAAKKVWSGAEYERAFDPRLSSELSAEEIDQLQAEAELAYQEGRIQW